MRRYYRTVWWFYHQPRYFSVALVIQLIIASLKAAEDQATDEDTKFTLLGTRALITVFWWWFFLRTIIKKMNVS